MPGPITTDDLLDQVRDQIDESNTDDVSDSDILQALNRGQRRAANFLVKQYEDMFIASTTLTSTGSDTFAIPEDSFGRRIDHITVIQGTTEYPLTRGTFRDLHRFTSSPSVPVPSIYVIKNRSFVVKPAPSSGVVLRVWYSKAPETLVLSQGRITTVSVASSYVLVDALGDDLTTSTDALGAFVNIVDAQTGEIKVSLQTLALDTATKKVSFKTSGLTYSTVYNRTIDTALPTTVDNHDYICSVSGTCVPDLPDACLDYLIQYAVTEIRRRMGESVQDDAAMLKQLEQEIERQWAGRETSHRVANKARHWTRL
jgi:hypothetical protein